MKPLRMTVGSNMPINEANIADTCGKCHYGVEETYLKSVHGQLLKKGDKAGPVCTDCHTAHEVEQPRTGHFKMASDQRCGKCHQDSLLHYRDTYHGKAMA
ncbi:MAG TPA: cytochrome c3 family protein, partial [Flavobacteriales bacterium]|nr:cytochrome c3 family protein [Flavobacteriales bacterium]